MNDQELIYQIEKCIEFAEKEQSKLIGLASKVGGMTSRKIKHFLNNLGEIPNRHYLEVGLHRGSTFIATNFKNNLSSSIGVDNWSQFHKEGESKQEFLENIKLLEPNSFKYYEKDCFALTKEDLPNPVNLFFFDGEHSHESQKMALTYFYPFLDDTFIFLVDDWNMEKVKSGTRQGISEMNLKILFEKELKEGWWNGFFVSLLKK